MGKFFKTIASGVSVSFLLYCVGCGLGNVQDLAPAVTPSISQVSPQTITAGTQTATLKVSGTNFPTKATILWNGAPVATTVVDANTLSGTVGSSNLSTPATVQLKVQNTQTMQESQAVPVVIAAPDTGSPTPPTTPTPPQTPTSPSPSAVAISTTSLPQGTVAAPYTVTLGASGGTSPYAWTITSGQLPAGLNLAANTGILSGTPTASGNFTIGVTATDTSSPAQTATATLGLSITAPPTTPSTLVINTSSLPSGMVDSGYFSMLQASGGTAPYTWSFVSGSLPAGLSLNTTTGVITGAPTTAGTATFTAAVADSASQIKTVNLSLAVAPVSLAIATSSVPSGTIGTGYSTLLQAGGGTAPYTWSITGGSLPAGLSLVSANGIITGTPTATGTFNFTATVADAGSPAQTKSANLSLVIASTTLGITSSALPSGTEGANYSQAIQANGGTAPYVWSMVSGALPAGLTFAPNGVVSGTPTVSGTFSIGVTVKDGGSPAQTATSNNISLVIVASGTPLSISSTSLPGGTPNQSYSTSLNATGGTEPYTWSITGNLPAGLTLAPNTGVISGTPTGTGTASFTATVTDAESPAQTKSVSLSIAVAATNLSLSTTSVPSATSGTGYSTLLQASGGTGPYTWSISAGALPAGLTLGATGLISGTPTATGTATFTATVKDAGNPAQSKSASLSIVVGAASASTLTIATSSVPSGTKGTAYNASLQAAGGTPAYTWSITSGSLPAGITLAPGTGILSGSPTASGTFTFTATVTDAGSPAQTKSVQLSLVVAAGSASTLTISTSSVPSGTTGTAYNASLQAAGGTPAYTWSITGGSLPSGIALAPGTGILSGNPTASGTSTFTVTVTDAGSPAQTKSVQLSLVVAAGGSSTLTISATLPSGIVGTSYSSAMSATGGTPAYTWSITGSLPAGLTLAATTGVISGNPTATGTFNFTAIVTDNSNPVQTKSVATSIVVGPASVPTGPGTTWYVRADGGTRYSANETAGQCDGMTDVAYSGSGTNQHCAFNDVRYLWTDGSYTTNPARNFPAWGWIGNGGDTYIIRGGPWRIGQVGPGNNQGFGLQGDPYDAGVPPPLNGTAGQHTRVLGENYAGCSTSNQTQLFGGYGVAFVLNLNGAAFVDVQCIELTRHSQCIKYGLPSIPAGCVESYPLDDYASDGISTTNSTHDILLQDMYIHGFTSRGIIGPIGGTINATRVDIAYNGAAGWDFDDGKATPNVNGVINLSYVTIEWNGCNQAYPGTGAVSCYSQSTGGYGDGIGTPPGTCLTAHVDHSTFRYNTQDGYDMLHNDTGNCSMSITDSQSYGNNGSQFKWGPNDNPMIFTNNLVLGNCYRLSAPFPGLASTYNANLTDFCRAQDTMVTNLQPGGSLTMSNNTIIGYSPTLIDVECSTTNCSTATFTFENNILMGYDNPLTYNGGGVVGGPGGLYFASIPYTIVRTNNIYYGIGHGFTCPTGYPNEHCEDPLLVNEPVFTGESSLDNFNFNITPGSPAKGAAIPIPSIPALLTDFTGQTRPTPPSIGAYN